MPEPEPKPKRRPGKAPYVPTEKDRLSVQVMIAGGIQQDAICAVIGITPPTLRRHYRRDIANGATIVNGMVVAEHLKKIKAGDFNAIKWWEQARMGWSEKIILANDPANLPMRVIVELVGDPAPQRADQSVRETGSRLSDTVRNTVQLVG